MGYENGITVAAATTLPFASTLAPIKVSNASTLHVSIPELGGITSFDGGRSDISRTIGVLTRGQFGTESVAGAQTAVSPFDNWVDCNNAQKVSLNSLTAQVRDDNGTLCADLRPETSLTLKVRQDPEFQRAHQIARILRGGPAMESSTPQIANVGS